jgi:hypothetical protein
MTNKIIIHNESKKPLRTALKCIDRVIELRKLNKRDCGNSFAYASQFLVSKITVYAELRKSGTVTFRVCDR